MNPLPWHPSQGPPPEVVAAAAAADLAERWGDVLVGLQDTAIAARADCCIGQPLYRVALVPEGGEPSDLLLCGHHYRASSARLAASGAHVVDASGHPVPPASVRRAS
jgi:hypothetical protein